MDILVDPRDYDYTDFKKIADEVGAITMADVAHIEDLSQVVS